jgi:hypothetical protein
MSRQRREDQWKGFLFRPDLFPFCFCLYIGNSMPPRKAREKDEKKNAHIILLKC